MKHIAWIALSWAALFTGNAQCADDAMPPEVKALVGMTIPAKAGDLIPGWKILGAGTLLAASSQTGQGLGYELLYQKNISIFVIDAWDKDRNRTILDARVLPQRLLRYDLKDGKIMPKKNASRLYAFEHGCKQKYTPDDIVIAGLVRPEPGKEDCEHWSRQVKRAWSIDPNTGRISDISPEDISCLYPAAESVCE